MMTVAKTGRRTQISANHCMVFPPENAFRPGDAGAPAYSSYNQIVRYRKKRKGAAKKMGNRWTRASSTVYLCFSSQMTISQLFSSFDTIREAAEFLPRAPK
jgi:hypothetical protein